MYLFEKGSSLKSFLVFTLNLYQPSRWWELSDIYRQQSLLGMTHTGPSSHRLHTKKVQKSEVGKHQKGRKEGEEWGRKEFEKHLTLNSSIDLGKVNLWKPQLFHLWNGDDKDMISSDTLTADFNVPYKLSSMIQHMVWFFTWHYLPKISPIYSLGTINIHLTKTVNSFRV